MSLLKFLTTNGISEAEAELILRFAATVVDNAINCEDAYAELPDAAATHAAVSKFYANHF